MERIKIFLLETSGSDRYEIAAMLANVEYLELSGDSGTTENVVEFLRENPVHVMLVGSDVEGDGYQAAEKILSEFPDLSVVMMESELKEDTMYKSIFIGAKDVIIKPFSASKLVNVIYRAYQLMQKKMILQKENKTESKNKSNLGQVITIFSTKGGVGRTFVSANLAVALLKATNKKVVLVDLDLDFGDAALALNLLPNFTISDIVDDIRTIDADVIESYLIPHESGIKVLPANAKPRITEFINAEHIDIILRTLQNAFDYIVVDLPARFYEPINPAFIAADNLLVITTPEISTVRNIKSSLMTLNDLNYTKSKIKILLNKADNKLEIKPKDIENTLKTNVYASIGADYKLVPSSLNLGIPIVLKYPKSSVSKEFMNLANKLVKEEKKA